MNPTNLLLQPLSLASPLGILRLDYLRPTDIEVIVELENRSHTHPWSRANFLSSLHSSHLCWGLWQDQTLMGYIILSLAAGEAELLLLVVAKQVQGQGLGKLLLESAIAQLNACARQFFLEVRASNTGAIYLYEALGFNQIGERRNYYPGKNGGETALVYGLNLNDIFN